MSTTTEQLTQSRKPFLLRPAAQVNVLVTSSPTAAATALGLPVFATGPTPKQLQLTRERLQAAGFTAEPSTTLALPRAEGPVMVAVGLGNQLMLDASAIRDAAAAFARAAASSECLAFSLEGTKIPIDAAARAVVEGIMLARYEYAGFGRESKTKPVEQIELIAPAAQQAAARSGAERGQAYAKATILARDLANTPHSHLTATQLGELAKNMSKQHGFEVEIFDKQALQNLDCGGLLGVNAGSVEPPCMIKLVYRPTRKSTGDIAIVGKGIMYDSGGISLKPNDNVHARMKNDMSGAAAVLATIAELRELDCTTTVTGYLMCTDNMPSGTAQALGDVITTHGGKTVEVTNTDAEGRLVMCDALAIASEETHDAILDIATLTGSVMRALGTDIAGLFGNDEMLIEQVQHAAEATGEPVWRLPLHRPYARALASDVASMRNAGPTGGTQPDGIVAALYLAEFVGDKPWAHIDICGTAWNDKDQLWHRAGCSGFGARLLLDLAMNFKPAARETRH